MSKRIANFRDPIGLVGRMLTSGNKAAYAALVREALSIAAVPADVLLSRFEQRRLAKAGPSEHPQIFIIGAPRSGTTLVYQALAYYLDVTFPPNTSAILKRSPITATLMQNRFGRRWEPGFTNFYGQTGRLSDCNDAFDMWNRWLGEDRYSPVTTLTHQQAEEMRTFFDTWTNAFNKPFLNKNNRNALAVEILAKHLPNARFVVVRRNPVMVAQSLIVAREKVQGDKKVGWGLESATTSDENDQLAYVNDVCSQINSIDSEMARQWATVDSDRVLNITYEGFCNHPQQTIRSIADRFPGVEIDPASNLDRRQPFEVSKKLKISNAELQRIRERLGLQQSATDEQPSH